MKYYSSSKGYDLYSKYYKNDYDLLDSFDWKECQKIINKSVENNKNINFNLLDIGSGDGRILKRLLRKYPNANYTGTDVSEQMLKLSYKKFKKQSNVELIMHNILKSNRLNNSIFIKESKDKSNYLRYNNFDYIILFFLLVHIQSLEIPLLFEKLYELKTKDGLIIFNNIPQKKLPKLHTKNGIFRIEAFHHDDQYIVDQLYDLDYDIVSKKEIYEETDHISTIFVIK